MTGGAAVLDPRVARSRRAIIDAVAEELSEVGYGAMTIESVARRAGVGKATIYRHWDGKLDLIESLLDEFKEGIVDDEEGPPLQKIRSMLHALATSLATSRLSQCLPALVSAAQHDDAVRAFHQRFSTSRRLVMMGYIEEAQLAGDIRGDADPRLLAELLVGPIFYRRLMTPDPFPPELVDQLVDTALPTP